MWVSTQILSLFPGFGKVIKAIDGDKEVRKLSKLGENEEARRLRSHMLNKYEIKYMGPLWRSEGMDQLYNLKNYHKALEAFEKAITCIEGRSPIAAMQYGVTQPIQVYYGAATAAIYISEKKKAKVYYKNFRELVLQLDYTEEYKDQLNWLREQIDVSETQTNKIN